VARTLRRPSRSAGAVVDGGPPTLFIQDSRPRRRASGDHAGLSEGISVNSRLSFSLERRRVLESRTWRAPVKAEAAGHDHLPDSFGGFLLRHFRVDLGRAGGTSWAPPSQGLRGKRHREQRCSPTSCSRRSAPRALARPGPPRSRTSHRPLWARPRQTLVPRHNVTWSSCSSPLLTCTPCPCHDQGHADHRPAPGDTVPAPTTRPGSRFAGLDSSASPTTTWCGSGGRGRR